jgi:hypothetical protein
MHVTGLRMITCHPHAATAMRPSLILLPTSRTWVESMGDMIDPWGVATIGPFTTMMGIVIDLESETGTGTCMLREEGVRRWKGVLSTSMQRQQGHSTRGELHLARHTGGGDLFHYFVAASWLLRSCFMASSWLHHGYPGGEVLRLAGAVCPAGSHSGSTTESRGGGRKTRSLSTLRLMAVTAAFRSL